MEDKIELLNKKATMDMLESASKFCLFMEHIAEYKQEQILEYLLTLCPLLYLKGRLIRSTEIDDNSACEQFVTEEQYELMRLAVKKNLQAIDFFEFYDANLRENQTLSLSEMLTDIYQDLKDFVLLYNKPQQIAKDAAVFMCCLNFANNWGSKIAILLPYIHSLVYKEKYEQYES